MILGAASFFTAMLAVSLAADMQQADTKTNSVPASAVVHDLKIFNGEKRLFATYGPSPSMGYPNPLQRKLYRYTGKNGVNCPLQISNYSIPGAQWRMPGWIDCKPSPNNPSQWEAFRSERYNNTVLKLIKDNVGGIPVIVLAMNNTGYSAVGLTPALTKILGPDDKEHIELTANFLRTHINVILADGAALYFLSPKKYSRILDDPNEWNRNEELYALTKVAAENIPGFVYVKGAWEDTAKYKELALVMDGHHTTPFGDEIIASKFFRALLEHDGLPVPAWDQEEVDAARNRQFQDMKRTELKTATALFKVLEPELTREQTDIYQKYLQLLKSFQPE
ncbi:MAG: hypothetical protein WCP55_09055 [Lentisphaerota bacterium]